MSIPATVSVATTVGHCASRLTLVAAPVLAILGLVAAAQVARAQTANQPTKSWEVRLTGGMFVPTGQQRDLLKDAQITAAQLSYVIEPAVAITGTVTWARSRDRMSLNTPKLDVFNYDLGIEARPANWLADRAVAVSPFVGLGAGARSYNYRKSDLHSATDVAGYGAVGAELGMGRVGLRLEVRDYLTGFAPSVVGKSGMRNDVVVMAALRFNRRASR
jgi:hypothetical protein